MSSRRRTARSAAVPFTPLTGCPRGCLHPGDNCCDCQPPPEGGGHCCLSLDFSQLAATTRLGLYCDQGRCARRALTGTPAAS